MMSFIPCEQMTRLFYRPNYGPITTLANMDDKITPYILSVFCGLEDGDSTVLI